MVYNSLVQMFRYGDVCSFVAKESLCLAYMFGSIEALGREQP
jgi:hypothetical protein